MDNIVIEFWILLIYIFYIRLRDNSVFGNVREILRDVVDKVRTPTPPLPDLKDSNVRINKFKEFNWFIHF